jgi:hypothetical protein
MRTKRSTRITHRNRAMARRAAAALALALTAAAHAGAGDTRLLYERDMQPKPVEVTAIDALSLRFTDEYGVRRSLPLSSLVAMLPARASAEPRAQQPTRTDPAGAWIELVDGQRFPGRLSPASVDDDSIQWRHDRFGQMSFPLESVAAVAFGEGADVALEQARAADSTQDIVTLVNGDRLAGFLVAIGAAIEIETDDAGPLEFDQQRVLWVRLASQPQAPGGMTVWFNDGAVARIDDLRATGEGLVELRLPSAASSVFEIAELDAVLFDAARILPLASLRPDEQAPIGRRTLVRPLRHLDDDASASHTVAPDLLLPGPMSVTWTLPPAAQRFSALATMPESSFPWGDCELVVLIDGRETLRHRLNRDHPAHEISVDARAATLTIRIEPGAFGPVRDVVELRRPLLLLDANAR